MTLAIHSPSAFSEPTTAFEKVFGAPPTGAPQTESVPAKCKVFRFDQYSPSEVETPANHTAIGELVAQWDKDATRKAAMEEARRWAAQTIHGDEGETVRTLRLRKGWSQAKLAEALNTSQPHVARIERGTENVSIDTCRRLSTALSVDMNTLDQALRRQEAVIQARAAR
jgi:ribosome-binding protein aMBF1 (putative translation factor)